METDLKSRYTLLVSTGRVHGPSTRGSKMTSVFTGCRHGCQKMTAVFTGRITCAWRVSKTGLFSLKNARLWSPVTNTARERGCHFDTRVHGPWSRVMCTDLNIGGTGTVARRLMSGNGQRRENSIFWNLKCTLFTNFKICSKLSKEHLAVSNVANKFLLSFEQSFIHRLKSCNKDIKRNAA